MNHYKFFRSTHKWLGILFAIVFLNIAVTGLLLLQKKSFTWIQPETKQGTQGHADSFITNQQLFETVFSQNHNMFRYLDFAALKVIREHPYYPSGQAAMLLIAPQKLRQLLLI